MDRFRIPFSLTDDLSLAAFLDKLKRHPLVEGLLVAGSGGRETLKPESDYDVVIVLRECPLPMHVVLTTVDHRMTDVAFWTTAQLDEMLTRDHVDGNSAEAVVFSWIQNGWIVYDLYGKLAQVKSHPITFDLADDSRQLFNYWYRINFNLYHGKRMLQSKDEVYLLAMDFRFLYMLLEVMEAYLLVRGIPQRGEKHFIRHLQEHDKPALDLYFRALHATDRQEKFKQYVDFARMALEPIGGLWDSEAVTAFNLHSDLPLENHDKLFDFWMDLLSS